MFSRTRSRTALAIVSKTFIDCPEKSNKKIKQRRINNGKVKYSKGFGGGANSLSSLTGRWRGLQGAGAERKLCRRQFGFTLAEVLITLGIIGVVAAMTMPAVINNYGKQEAVVRLKKFSSTMQNALNLATVDYGPVQTWQFPKKQNDADEINSFVNTYLFPYLTGIEKCNAGETNCKRFVKNLYSNSVNYLPVYVFSDGGCFGLVTGGASELSSNIHFLFDYNCLGKPNKYGKDIFQFVVTFGNGRQYPKFNSGGLRMSNAKTREDLIDLCKNITSEYQKSDCAALIEYDGWQIKDDYPWW